MVGDDFKARFDGNARNGVVVRDTEPVAIAIELIVVNDEQQQKFAFVNTHHMTRSPNSPRKKISTVKDQHLSAPITSELESRTLATCY